MSQSHPRTHLARPLEHPAVRQAVKFAIDLGFATAAWMLACKSLGHSNYLFWGLQVWLPLAMTINFVLRLPRQHYRLVGFRDALMIALALPALALGSWGYARLLSAPPPLGLLLEASLLTCAFWGTFRGAFRAGWDHVLDFQVPAAQHHQDQRTLIVGAGKAGLLVAQELARHRELGHLVGYIDDALEKQGILIQGKPVLGTSEILAAIIRERDISQVILAIPSASGQSMRALTERLRNLPVKLKTVPGLFDLLGSRSWRPELRDISIEDLLRREPVSLDQSALAQIIEDEVVLITGAGGSIGSELARQVAPFRPARIVLLGRGENSLWECERTLRQAFPNQSLALELCDIRNEHRLRQVFERWNPAVLLHAAAHKHVPFLEAQPAEAVENNVFGTLKVLEASLAHGVHTFVNISTDKAVNPTNVLGATKRIAECLVLRAAAQAPEGAHYASVRFGNVLGSRGSVIPVFKDQIKQGGPVTVTHPDMTRYFMTIPEASQLVLQAGLLGDTGKVYVLDMGKPVKIVDLAMDMVRLSGLVPDQDVEIQFTGMRPGEKLFEELFTDREQRQSPVHPKVFEGMPEMLDLGLLEEGLQALRRAVALPEGDRQREILRWLKTLVPTYNPSQTGLGRFEGNGPRSSGGFRVPSNHRNLA